MRVRLIVLSIALLILPRLAEAGPRKPERRPAEKPEEAWAPPSPTRPVRQPVADAPRVRQPRVRQPRITAADRPMGRPIPVDAAQPVVGVLPPTFPELLPVWEPAPVLEREYVSISSAAGICELSVEDDYLAWQLADVTGRTYWEIAVARGEGWSWPTALRELQIEEGELLLALHFPAEDDVLPLDWNDDDVAGFVQMLIGDHVLPEVECEDGFWVNPSPTFERRAHDARDHMIAGRIAAQTGYSVENLLLAHREFHHWSEVGRVFSMSPYLFEVVFDLELPGVWRGESLHLDYPGDAVLRDSVGKEEPRRMSWAPETPQENGALRTGLKWATFFGIMTLVGGLAG
jgi:hypothetical protein